MIVTSIGLLSEYVQTFFNRDADVFDLLRDFSGASIGLLFTISFDNRFDRRTRFVTRISSLFLFLIVISPFSIAYYIVQFRNHSVPEIYTFEKWWEHKFLSTYDANLQFVKIPEAWTANHSKSAGKITFLQGEFSGIHFSKFFHDWSRFNTLQIELYSEVPDSFSLDLRINDRHHNNDYYDRFNRRLLIKPGENKFIIPILDIVNSPRSRLLDSKHITDMHLFIYKNHSSRIVYIDNIELLF